MWPEASSQMRKSYIYFRGASQLTARADPLLCSSVYDACIKPEVSEVRASPANTELGAQTGETAETPSGQLRLQVDSYDCTGDFPGETAWGVRTGLGPITG